MVKIYWLIIYLLLGSLVGFAASLLGIGGGIMVPVLLLRKIFAGPLVVLCFKMLHTVFTA